MPASCCWPHPGSSPMPLRWTSRVLSSSSDSRPSPPSRFSRGTPPVSSSAGCGPVGAAPNGSSSSGEGRPSSIWRAGSRSRPTPGSRSVAACVTPGDRDRVATTVGRAGRWTRRRPGPGHQARSGHDRGHVGERDRSGVPPAALVAAGGHRPGAARGSRTDRGRGATPAHPAVRGLAAADGGGPPVRGLAPGGQGRGRPVRCRAGTGGPGDRCCWASPSRCGSPAPGRCSTGSSGSASTAGPSPCSSSAAWSSTPTGRSRGPAGIEHLRRAAVQDA